MISKWWSKYERTLASRLEFCSNPVKIACWYRYQKSTGALLLWGIGTSLFGTDTNSVLHVGTGTIMCDTGTTSLQMLPLTVALPGASRQWLPSTAIIYICSLDTNPYKKCAHNSKNLHKHKNMRTIKGTYSYTK